MVILKEKADAWCDLSCPRGDKSLEGAVGVWSVEDKMVRALRLSVGEFPPSVITK